MKKLVIAMSFVAFAMVGVVATPDEGSALPNFARQTGNPCFACHFQHIPKLNAFGRSFKLSAYSDATVDMIEDDLLSTPATMPLGFVTKLRYQTETKKTASEPEEKGKERGEWQLPDEAAFWMAGRIAEGIGYAIEWPAGWATGKVMFSAPIGDVIAGVSIYSTDALGPAFGQELFNTGILRSVRSFENRKETIVGHIGGTTYGAAQGLTFYAGNEMFFAAVGLWGPAFEHVDTGFDLSTWYRLAFTPNLGGFDVMIGVFGTGGETKCVECAEIGANDDHSLQTFKTEYFGVDFQAQGELGNGMTLELQAMMITAGSGTIYAESDGFNFIADLGINPALTVKLAYMTYTDKSGSSDVETNATSVGLAWNVAQNLSLRPEFSFFGGDGASKDNAMTLMLMGGF